MLCAEFPKETHKYEQRALGLHKVGSKQNVASVFSGYPFLFGFEEAIRITTISGPKSVRTQHFAHPRLERKRWWGVKPAAAMSSMASVAPSPSPHARRPKIIAWEMDLRYDGKYPSPWIFPRNHSIHVVQFCCYNM